jgi:nucleoside-diphosphate-sugar epimerase
VINVTTDDRTASDSSAILVTGAAGFFGTHVVRGLLAQGYKVIAYDAAPEQGFYDGWITAQPTLTYVQGDVLDFPRLFGAIVDHGVTDVVQATAFFGSEQEARIVGGRGDAAGDDVIDFLRLNISIVWQLCELFRRVSGLRRLVTISSRGAYGAYRPDEGLITEDAAYRPTGFYGVSKASADMALAAYRKLHGVDAVALRVTGLYGPLLSEARKDRFLKTHTSVAVWPFVDAAVSGKPLHWDTGGDFVWEFNFVKDAVAGVLRVLRAPSLKWPVYNVGGGQGYSLSRVAQAVNAAVPGAEVTVGPGQLPRTPVRGIMSTARIADELGYQPRWSLEDGVRELARWWGTGEYGADVSL